MESRFVFRDRGSGEKISPIRHATVTTNSDALGWTGLRLEVGHIRGIHLDDVMVDGHLVGFNPTEHEQCFETRSDAAWFSARMPPRTFWIIPEGRPYSVKHSIDSSWATAAIDGHFLDSVLGRHYELDAGVGVSDELLAGLMQSLVINLQHRAAASSTLDAELIRAFVVALATRRGKPAAELGPKGGISPHQMKTLTCWIEEHLAGNLTIDEMAAQIGLSVAHFSREFKRSMGQTPWGYVIQRRIERACRLVAKGESLSAVAFQCGFTDQSHMARLFKQRLGVSPSSYVREAGRLAGEEERKDHLA